MPPQATPACFHGVNAQQAVASSNQQALHIVLRMYGDLYQKMPIHQLNIYWYPRQPTSMHGVSYNMGSRPMVLIIYKHGKVALDSLKQTFMKRCL